jgi:hypothetical protein
MTDERRGTSTFFQSGQAYFSSLERLFEYVGSPAELATQEFLESANTVIIFYEIQDTWPHL